MIQKWQPEESEKPIFYEDPAKKSKERQSAYDRFDHWKNCFDSLTRFADIRGKKMLEMGCSYLRDPATLFRLSGAKVFGIDVDLEKPEWQDDFKDLYLRISKLPAFKEISKNNKAYADLIRAREELNIQQVDIYHTSFDDRFFDIVYSIDVFEHLVEPKRALLEMKRIVADDGYIYIHYQPFFSRLGAHHLSIPIHWGHLRLTKEEFNVISQLVSGDENDPWQWIGSNLNRVSLREFRDLLKEVGLRPIYWNNRIEERPKVLDGQLEKQLEIYPEEELLTDIVRVLLVKDESQSQKIISTPTLDGDDASKRKNVQVVLEKIERYVDKGTKHFKSPDPTTDLAEFHMDVTHKCNSRCIHCNWWQTPAEELKNELTLDEIKRFVSDSKYLENLELVVFTGGEPFLREDIVELAGFFIKRYPQAALIILTNGLNTDLVIGKTKQIIEKYNPASFLLGSSIDGIGEVHDRVRGVKGFFNKLVKTIQAVQKELPNIDFALNYTVTPQNYQSLLKVYEYVEDLPATFSAQMQTGGITRGDHPLWTDEQLSEIESTISMIIDRMITHYRQTNNLPPDQKIEDTGFLAQIYYWSKLVPYERNPERFLKWSFGGNRFAMFNPDGTLMVCPFYREDTLGSIRKKPFDELWMSEKAQNLRKVINAGKCSCWLVCTQMPLLGKVIHLGQRVVREQLEKEREEMAPQMTDQQIKELEEAIRQKDQHIYNLEQRLARFESTFAYKVYKKIIRPVKTWLGRD